MLKDTLFKVTSLDHQKNVITATLEIDKNNEVFAGHFPGQPVLPGACMLQIIKEVFESTLTISVRIKKADYIKFPALIDPRNNNILQLTLSYKSDDTINFYVTADLTAQQKSCFKFKGSFVSKF